MWCHSILFFLFLYSQQEERFLRFRHLDFQPTCFSSLKLVESADRYIQQFPLMLLHDKGCNKRIANSVAQVWHVLSLQGTYLLLNKRGICDQVVNILLLFATTILALSRRILKALYERSIKIDYTPFYIGSFQMARLICRAIAFSSPNQIRKIGCASWSCMWKYVEFSFHKTFLPWSSFNFKIP